MARISPSVGRHRRSIALIVGFFLLAFVLDMATGQRHSNMLGSAAIAASIVVAWPWHRSILLDLGGYVAAWGVFAFARANIPRLELALAGPHAVGNLETTFFAGRLPSAALQHALFDPDRTQVLDLAAIAVHLSFFLAPTGVAIALRARDRPRFVRYWTATVVMLGLATIGFLLVPTAPPWLQTPGQVQRVIVQLGIVPGDALTDQRSAALAFDPNRLAAMPSVHVAAAALVALAAWQSRRSVRWFGAGYGMAMSVSVIYLGEHYLLDVLGGWTIAFAGWWLSARIRATTPPRLTPAESVPRRAT